MQEKTLNTHTMHEHCENYRADHGITDIEHQFVMEAIDYAMGFSADTQIEVVMEWQWMERLYPLAVAVNDEVTCYAFMYMAVVIAEIAMDE
jgi:hypothetical protein